MKLTTNLTGKQNNISKKAETETELKNTEENANFRNSLAPLMALNLMSYLNIKLFAQFVYIISSSI